MRAACQTILRELAEGRGLAVQVLARFPKIQDGTKRGSMLQYVLTYEVNHTK